MARTIATIGGIGLAPGVSKNRRWYTREHLAGAVAAAQERLAAGDQPMVMLTHHDANDDSTRIAAALRSVTLTKDSKIRWSADIPDTAAGREIAALADTSDGKPAFLDGVSIRGQWTGKVRKVRGPDGEPVETADGLVIDGLDFTHKPGVAGARVDTFAWAAGGAAETDERVPITESVEEARVTFTEEAPPAPDGVREALRSLFGEAISGGGTPPVHKRDSGLSDGSGRKYADPGYQKDHKQRYDISTKSKAKAAWSFVNQAGNAKLYSSAQLKNIKARIVKALKGFGVTVAAEGWCIEPALLITEAIAEYAGLDPECCGSYSLSATNGPTTVTVCSYGLDPADLHVVLAQACAAASAALCSIDPDMDGDIDLPGAEAEDTDGDAAGVAPGVTLPDNGDGVDTIVARIMAAVRGESAEDLGALIAEAKASAAATEAVPEEDPAPDLAAANQGTEAPVPETTTTEAAATAPAATFTQADLDAAAARAVAQAEEARRARKAAKRAAQAAPAAETTVTPAAAAVTETDDQRIARLVDAKVAEALAAGAVQETEDQKIARLVEERLLAERQRLTESGHGPGRKGLAPGGAVNEHSGARPSGDASLNSHGLPADWPDKPLHQYTSDEMEQYANVALTRHVLGAKADLLG